jgi:uncharacterized spore protein YtfJ
MSVPEVLKSIGERFESSVTVKNVFGEAISAGERTVIPVARISYAFGGGGGDHQGHAATGGGGGGRMAAVPVGAVEITPHGTQFIPFLDWRRLGSVAAISFAMGLLIGMRRAR